MHTSNTIVNSTSTLNFIWLELTQKCNLTCVHCYNDSSPHQSLEGDMTLENWKTVLIDAFDQGCRSVQFIGGEATMHPHLDELITFAKKLGYTFIELFSNLTIIDDELVECLKNNEVQVAGSMYSDRPEIHDSITTRKGSFQKTISGITRLVNENIPLRIAIVEMDKNHGHSESTKSFLKDLGVIDVKSDGIREYGRGNNTQELGSNNSYDGLCGECWKGKLCVTPNGDVHPCVMSRMVLTGNVTRQPLSDITNSSQLLGFQEIMKESYSSTGIDIDGKCGPLTCLPNRCSPQVHCGPDNPCSPKVGCSPDSCKSL